MQVYMVASLQDFKVAILQICKAARFNLARYQGLWLQGSKVARLQSCLFEKLQNYRVGRKQKSKDGKF